MSNILSNDDSDEEERRSAYVKWSGKTIALGTFSATEADRRRELAKQITQRWRETMNPRPDIEWAKRTLEELNIREVNDKPGRRKLDDVAKSIRAAKRKRLALQSSGTQLNPLTSGQVAEPLHNGKVQHPYINGFEQKRMIDFHDTPVDYSSRLSNQDRWSFPSTTLLRSRAQSYPENHSSKPYNSIPKANGPHYQTDRIRDMPMLMPNARLGVSSSRYYKHLQNHLNYLLEELRQTNQLLGMYRLQEREETLLRMRSNEPLHVFNQLNEGRSREIERYLPRKSYPSMNERDSEQYYPNVMMENTMDSGRRAFVNTEPPPSINLPHFNKIQESDKRRSYSSESNERSVSLSMPPLGNNNKSNDLDASAADSLLLMHSRKDSTSSANSPGKLHDYDHKTNPDRLEGI